MEIEIAKKRRLTQCESKKVQDEMNLVIELEQETDGRWIAEIDALNGVLVYGETREDAVRKVKTLAFRVIADRLENGESLPQELENQIFETV